jgi:hypothetical protein
MSITADVATGAAERVEKSAGPAAGLAVWRRLAFNAGGAEIRGRAILGGLRCAIAVHDFGAIRDLTQLWQTVEVVSESDWDGLFATCKAMWRSGLGVLATELASAEVRRRAPRHVHSTCVCAVPRSSRATRRRSGGLRGGARRGREARARRAWYAGDLPRPPRRVARAELRRRSNAALEEAKRGELARRPRPPSGSCIARVLLPLAEPLRARERRSGCSTRS